MCNKCHKRYNLNNAYKCNKCHKRYNLNNAYNVFNLFGLRLRFESQMPEDFVDPSQVNNIFVNFVQKENLLDDSSFGTVTALSIIAIGQAMAHDNCKRKG